MKLMRNLNEHDSQQLKKQIKRFLLSRQFDTNKRANTFRGVTTFKQIDELLGLAYTSSGRFAGLFICNVTLFFDEKRKYQIYGFCMDCAGHCLAYCLDTENGLDELYVPIS